MYDVVALQPIAIVDHVARVDKEQAKQIVGATEELYGSRRVDHDTFAKALNSVGTHRHLKPARPLALRSLGSGICR